MITANIKNADKYFCVNRNFENVFNFLKTLDKDTEPFDFEYVQNTVDEDAREIGYGFVVSRDASAPSP